MLNENFQLYINDKPVKHFFETKDEAKLSKITKGYISNKVPIEIRSTNNLGRTDREKYDYNMKAGIDPWVPQRF